MTPAASPIGRIGRHPKRPERLALILPNGQPGAWFGQADTAETVAAVLARQGYQMQPCGLVVKPENKNAAASES